MTRSEAERAPEVTGVPVEVVTFDYWNTLVATNDGSLYERRAEAWSEILATAGFRVTAEDLRLAFQASWTTFREHWKANRQFVTADGVARVLEVLEVDVDDEVRATLLEHFGDAARTTELRLAPNLAEALDRLKAADVRLGIICDVGMTPSPTLRDHLERFGILDRFDHWSFSDEVGVYKPSPEIFAHALEGLGGSPETSAHVGDLRRTDVAGAKAAGWRSVRYAGLHDDDGSDDDLDLEADHVVHDHVDLPAVLL